MVHGHEQRKLKHVAMSYSCWGSVLSPDAKPPKCLLSVLSLSDHQYWGSDLQLPKMPFEEVLCNDESAYKWLCTLKKVGIVLLTGAAAREGELLKLGHRIGFLRLTFYG